MPDKTARPGSVAADGDRQVVPAMAVSERVGYVHRAAVGRHAVPADRFARIVIRRHGEGDGLGSAVREREPEPWLTGESVRGVGRPCLGRQPGSADVAGEVPQEAVRAPDRDVVLAGPDPDRTGNRVAPARTRGA